MIGQRIASRLQEFAESLGDEPDERIVRLLSDHPGVDFTPTMIIDRTGVNSGRVFASLLRLESDGRVESWWQPGPYPRQRRYRWKFERRRRD